MSSRRIRALALVALLAARPAGADALAPPPGVEPLSDAALDALRGQALIEWQGVVLSFSLERSASLDGRPLSGAELAAPLVIQNRLDARTIEVITTLNATLSNARWLRDQRIDASLRDAVRALR